MRAVVRILVACTPVHGHLAPLLRATRELVRRSNEVVVLTGSRFEAAVAATGARHVALPAGADYDDRDLNASFPGRVSKRGPAKLNFDVVHLFADPVPHQYRALEELRREFRPDAVLADTAFGGAAVWALSGAADRPPVVVANVTFLTLSGRGVPPAGVGLTPMPGPVGRARDALVLLLAFRLGTVQPRVRDDRRPTLTRLVLRRAVARRPAPGADCPFLRVPPGGPARQGELRGADVAVAVGGLRPAGLVD